MVSYLSRRNTLETVSSTFTSTSADLNRMMPWLAPSRTCTQPAWTSNKSWIRSWTTINAAKTVPKPKDCPTTAASSSKTPNSSISGLPPMSSKIAINSKTRSQHKKMNVPFWTNTCMANTTKSRPKYCKKLRTSHMLPSKNRVKRRKNWRTSWIRRRTRTRLRKAPVVLMRSNRLRRHVPSAWRTRTIQMIRAYSQFAITRTSKWVQKIKRMASLTSWRKGKNNLLNAKTRQVARTQWAKRWKKAARKLTNLLRNYRSKNNHHKKSKTLARRPTKRRILKVIKRTKSPKRNNKRKTTKTLNPNQKRKSRKKRKRARVKPSRATKTRAKRPNKKQRPWQKRKLSNW